VDAYYANSGRQLGGDEVEPAQVIREARLPLMMMGTPFEATIGIDR